MQAQNPVPVRLIAPCDLEAHVKSALGTLVGPTGNRVHALRSRLNQCGRLPRAPALGARLFAFATANSNPSWPRREAQRVCFFNAVISHTLNDGGKRKGGGEMKSHSWSAVRRIPFASQKQLNPITPSSLACLFRDSENPQCELWKSSGRMWKRADPSSLIISLRGSPTRPPPPNRCTYQRAVWSMENPGWVSPQNAKMNHRDFLDYRLSR